jgi:hypothetical protein
MIIATIVPTPRKGKKWRAIITEDKKLLGTVDFGAKGYSDFPQHKDKTRRMMYLKRHSINQDWTRTGMLTAGFWCRWLLWNKPTLRGSGNDIKKRFGITVRFDN